MTPEADRMLNPERPTERLEEKAARLALLTPPGPALRLHEAAEKLRAAAEAAIEIQKVRGRAPDQWAYDLDNYLGGPIGVLCGLLSPELALDLADFLDATAADAVRQARMGGSEEAVTDGYPTTMARRILGERA
ncbi:hypothetical protein OG552_10695 [Streptomyces sp. NBC_01476]|uniref:hypothetical protein n=1 Tax=Streptomyces sp. NBC_01476 TaxID=2903881 RepID=UPI002E2EA8BA|nr:hypothetical protein [Streptomyces sp. NBC_01476]